VGGGDGRRAQALQLRSAFDGLYRGDSGKETCRIRREETGGKKFSRGCHVIQCSIFAKTGRKEGGEAASPGEEEPGGQGDRGPVESKGKIKGLKGVKKGRR